MNEKVRKTLAKSATALVAISILAYIFWPQSQEVIEEVADTTTIPEQTTTTTVKIDESACLVLFVKDSDKFLIEETACVNTYVDRVISGFYSKLSALCRSSGDGSRVNREELSLKRSEALQFSLLKMGVKYEQLDVKSVSDDSPYAGVDPTTEEGKVLNRSCEINGVK